MQCGEREDAAEAGRRENAVVCRWLSWQLTDGTAAVAYAVVVALMQSLYWLRLHDLEADLTVT